jgi:hypothetical protein
MQSKRHSKQSNNLDGFPSLPQKGAEEPLKASSETPSPELLALFRLLVREPPPDHDFNACPVCKRYGITHI